MIMFSKEELEKMSDEEIAEKIDKFVSNLSYFYAPACEDESEWKNMMLRYHEHALKETDRCEKHVDYCLMITFLECIETNIQNIKALIRFEDLKSFEK